jgi:hypothetical protein
MQAGIAQSRHHSFNMRLGNERTGRTCCYTLTAVHTTGHVHSFIKGGADNRLGTAIDKIDAGNALYFVADPDALSALDTLFVIADNRFAGGIDGISAALSDESSAANAEGFGKFPKLASFIAFAKEAIIGMIGEEQFDDHSSCGDDAVSLGFDFHPGGYGKGTGGDEASLSFDFNDTDAAGTCW